MVGIPLLISACRDGGDDPTAPALPSVEPGTTARPVAPGPGNLAVGAPVVSDLSIARDGSQGARGRSVAGEGTVAGSTCLGGSCTLFRWSPTSGEVPIAFPADIVGPTQVPSINSTGDVVYTGFNLAGTNFTVFQPAGGSAILESPPYAELYGQVGTALSDAGLVAALCTFDGTQYPQRACLWNPRTRARTDLGLLPGGFFSVALGINERGWAVGFGNMSLNGGPFMPARWRNGAVEVLPLPPGGTCGVAVAINERGDAVGGVSTLPEGGCGADGSAILPALWPSEGGVIVLPDLGQPYQPGVGVSIAARDIADDGVIVGAVLDPNRPNVPVPVIWPNPREIHQLPLPPGSSPLGPAFGTAYGIESVNGTYYVVGELTLFAVVRWTLSFANQPPVPQFAITTPAGDRREGSPVALDASASTDPEADALSFAWTFGDGGSGTGAAPSHTYADNGTYTVTLTATDAAGSSASTSSSVVIENVPVQIGISSATGATAGANSQLQFSLTDAGAQDAPWAWSVDWGDGTTPATGQATTNGATVTLTHVYAQAGSFTATVTARDKDQGASEASSAQATIAVSAATAPVASANGPYNGRQGQPISFSAAGSQDFGRGPLTYLWSFGDGATSSAAAPSHTYAQDGSYTATLRVTNIDGLSAEATATVTVADNPFQLTVETCTAPPPTRRNQPTPQCRRFRVQDADPNDGPYSWSSRVIELVRNRTVGTGGSGQVPNGGAFDVIISQKPGSYLLLVDVRDVRGVLQTLSVPVTVPR